MITISGENVFKLNSVPHDWKTCLLDEAVKIQGGSQPPIKVFRYVAKNRERPATLVNSSLAGFFMPIV